MQGFIIMCIIANLLFFQYNLSFYRGKGERTSMINLCIFIFCFHDSKLGVSALIACGVFSFSKIGVFFTFSYLIFVEISYKSWIFGFFFWFKNFVFFTGFQSVIFYPKYFIKILQRGVEKESNLPFERSSPLSISYIHPYWIWKPMSI